MFSFNICLSLFSSEVRITVLSPNSFIKCVSLNDETATQAAITLKENDELITVCEVI